MKAFLDTSVLVPVFLADHDQHKSSFALFVRCDTKNACCAAHTLAEVYSTLTRLPGKHRVSADHAVLFLQEIRQRLTTVALDEEEYYAAILQASSAGVTGGAIYDALLAQCGIKAKATTLYTWNLRHFRSLGRDIASRVKTP